ncbi:MULTISPECIES: hypothetical protein [unclassified Sphingomonas]|jgi:hypothetical protein|nr:hypothetical protein [Sphingomonas sp. FARSPH]
MSNSSITRNKTLSSSFIYKENALVFFLSAVAIIFLYAKVAAFNRYAITIGGIFCPIAFILSLRRFLLNPFVIMSSAFFIIWPLIVMVGCTVFQSSLTPEFNQFIASYSLWAISVLLISMAFLTRKPMGFSETFVINIIILFFATLQWLGTSIFNTYIGYDIVQPLLGSDLFNSYLNIEDIDKARAIGTYYEPSMCGRVIGTLCLIDVIRTKKVARNLLIVLIGLAATKSLGLIILVAVLGVVLLGRNVKELVSLVLAGLVLFSIQGALVSQRLVTQAGDQYSSTYRRIIAPIETLGFAAIHYPLGIPIGSAELLAERTGYAVETGESKITNGTYEFITYFGLLGILVLASVLFSSFTLVAYGEREYAACILYIGMSTALSGSFLSIESSLLTYFFISSCISAREIRKTRNDV